MNRNKARREAKSSKFGVFGIGLIVASILGVLLVQTNNLKAKDASLRKQEKELSEQLEKESKRTEELEEKKIYVQTKKYIEEVAKKLGYVYPDEIIFKPHEEEDAR